MVLHLAHHPGAAGALFEGVPDFEQDAVAVRVPLAVPEAELGDAFGGQDVRTGLVVLDLFGEAVLEAVEFDGQARGGAVEVQEVVADRMLAAELEPGEATGSQGAPEFAFFVGLLATQATGGGSGVHGSGVKGMEVAKGVEGPPLPGPLLPRREERETDKGSGGLDGPSLPDPLLPRREERGRAQQRFSLSSTRNGGEGRGEEVTPLIPVRVQLRRLVGGRPGGSGLRAAGPPPQADDGA